MHKISIHAAAKRYKRRNISSFFTSASTAKATQHQLPPPDPSSSTHFATTTTHHFTMSDQSAYMSSPSAPAPSTGASSAYMPSPGGDAPSSAAGATSAYIGAGPAIEPAAEPVVVGLVGIGEQICIPSISGKSSRSERLHVRRKKQRRPDGWTKSEERSLSANTRNQIPHDCDDIYLCIVCMFVYVMIMFTFDVIYCLITAVIIVFL